MRLPRFTTLQLLLAATLVALLLGLFSSAWRIGAPHFVERIYFSPSGKRLAVRLSTGAVQIWQVDQARPRQVAKAFGTPPLPRGGHPEMLECAYFIDDTRLLKLESDQQRSRVTVREMEVTTGKVSEVLQIPLKFAQQLYVAANESRLYVAGWGTNNG